MSEAARVAREAPPGELATPARRAGAALLDGAFVALAAGLGVGVARVLAGPCHGMGCEVIPAFGAGGALVVVVIVQVFFMTTRGQSVGKRLVGLRVTRADGSPVGFLRGVVLRALVVALVPAALFGACELVWQSASADPEGSTLVRAFGYSALSNLLTVIPAVLSALFVLVDVVFALLPGRRALHDRLTGTFVTRVLD